MWECQANAGTPDMTRSMTHFICDWRNNENGNLQSWRPKTCTMEGSVLSATPVTGAGHSGFRRPIPSQFNWEVLLCNVIPDGKTGLTAQFWQAIAQASELSFPVVFHTQNCAVHSVNPTVSSVYLPNTTTASSQGTSGSSNSFSRRASHDIFLFKYHFLLHILRFIFFFSDNIMADVASKQQTTALFLPTIVTRTRRHTELTKNWQTWWETCAVPENIQLFLVQFFTQLNCAA